MQTILIDPAIEINFALYTAMNLLQHETSPYLLQHKNNPVYWMPYGDDAFKKARLEQKLVLISIGYSSCHWCHVMEKEVFEDHGCAEVMNKFFVCIKVDREERPDVDHYYMDAVHLMGGRGGWPLNVFTLPDGRPVYGGTYFPKLQWINILEKLADLYRDEPEKMMEYATSLSEGLWQLSVVQIDNVPQEFNSDVLRDLVKRWSQHWDLRKGGMQKAPKFPMPGNWEFLLHYASVFSSTPGKEDGAKGALDMVFLTLDNMAMGGIYDHVGGGFCRYSVDAEWKIPHFEKMLYDNAQLLSLYARAYQVNSNSFYLRVIEETIAFVDRELTSPEGLFYSALDADSEGEEGKYYVWTEPELREVLGNDADFAIEYFSVGKEALWEHDKNNLLTPVMIDDYTGFSGNDGIALVKSIKNRLLNKRNERVRPGLDFKCITSWNALMVKALADVYSATGNTEYLNRATAVMHKIWELMYTEDGTLYRIRTSGRTTIPGFLDDYSFLTEACIVLFQAGGEKLWYDRALLLIQSIQQKFYDSRSGLFRFGTSSDPHSQKLDTQDNVMPSSNSCLARCLFLMSHITLDDSMAEVAKTMLQRVMPGVDYASGYTGWLQLYLWNSEPFFEIAITGPEASILSQLMRAEYTPQIVVAASTTESELPLLKGKFGRESAIYVCEGKTCFPPVDDVVKARAYIK